MAMASRYHPHPDPPCRQVVLVVRHTLNVWHSGELMKQPMGKTESYPRTEMGKLN